MSGWRPDFLPADAQFARQAKRLRALVGQQLIEAWTVWFVDDDWFADLPVVLRFDTGAQLEIAWEKFDDLSITWDTIDVGVPPVAWVERPLEWRRNADHALLSRVGGVVTDIRATRGVLETQSVDDPSDTRARWLTTGVWLATDRGDLRIFNALDENGLDSEAVDPDSPCGWRAL
ncbi:hypothetical protein ASE16_15170 [Leifsonia sp. Root227]|nr:hypothetical protein ASE16_15170 [Leifsonia sp. Root227]